jgi:phosphoenolpyruvate carboxykinase (ATP)
MKIAFTRAMVRAALEGELAHVPMQREPHFGLTVPISCPEVPGEVLLPRKTWRDPGAYDEAARDVARRFDANFRQFEPFVDERVKAAAIHPAA